MPEKSVLDPNIALKKTVLEYLEFPYSPRYALLLSGSWGVGKTHLINELRESELKGKKFFYVSLYGVTNKDQFDAAVVASIIPFMDSKIFKKATAIGGAALGLFGRSLSLKPGKIVETVKDGIYLFDDLERSGLEIQHLLGMINPFVEHDGCKVIIVANEDEISNKKEFLRRKEKLIGRTLKVIPNFKSAIDSFLVKIKNDKTKKKLIEHQDQISRIYNFSQVNNLRILQQSLWDLEKLIIALPSFVESKEDQFSKIISLFFLISLKVKQGSITQEELIKRTQSLFSEAKKKKSTVFTDLNAVSDEVDVFDQILSNEILAECLFNGNFDTDEINAYLSKRHEFTDESIEPEWQTLWKFSMRDGEVLKAAFKSLEEKFHNYEYIEIGQILHVYGLRLSLASKGILKKSSKDIIKESNSYTDKMLSNGLLEPLEPDHMGTFWKQSAYGFGYSCRETTEFKKILNHFIKSRGLAYDSKVALDAPNLLQLMVENNSEFIAQITWSNGSPSKYAKVPILNEIPAKEFVEGYLSLKAEAQYETMAALHARYDHKMLSKDLAHEKKWLEDVKSNILEEIEEADIYSKTRILQHLEWYLDSYLS